MAAAFGAVRRRQWTRVGASHRLDIGQADHRLAEAASQPADSLRRLTTPAVTVIGSEWNRPYSQQKAVFPLPWVKANKFWPSVGRLDDTFGDRNVVCSCPPIEDYMSPEPSKAA